MRLETSYVLYNEYLWMAPFFAFCIWIETCSDMLRTCHVYRTTVSHHNFLSRNDTSTVVQFSLQQKRFLLCTAIKYVHTSQNVTKVLNDFAKTYFLSGLSREITISQHKGLYRLDLLKIDIVTFSWIFFSKPVYKCNDQRFVMLF